MFVEEDNLSCQGKKTRSWREKMLRKGRWR
jgi:hypothetical protein